MSQDVVLTQMKAQYLTVGQCPQILKGIFMIFLPTKIIFIVCVIFVLISVQFIVSQSRSQPCHTVTITPILTVLIIIIIFSSSISINLSSALSLSLSSALLSLYGHCLFRHHYQYFHCYHHLHHYYSHYYYVAAITWNKISDTLRSLSTLSAYKKAVRQLRFQLILYDIYVLLSNWAFYCKQLCHVILGFIL